MTYEIYEPVTNFTTVPNIILDVMMAEISNAELRVLLALVRKTYGWQKQADKVSLSQLQSLTGMTRKSVIAGIAGLEQHGVVTCERGTNGGCNYYTVRVKKTDEGSIPSTLGESLGSISSIPADEKGSLLGIPTKESPLKEIKELNKDSKDSTAKAVKPKSKKQKAALEAQDKSPEQIESERITTLAHSYLRVYHPLFEKFTRSDPNDKNTGAVIAYPTLVSQHLKDAKALASDPLNVTQSEFRQYLEHLIDTDEIKKLIFFGNTDGFPKFKDLNKGIKQFVIDKLRDIAYNNGNEQASSSKSNAPVYASDGLGAFLKKSPEEQAKIRAEVAARLANETENKF